MLNVYQKIYRLLTPHERRHFYLLSGMILVMALLETVGVASILPFMAVLADPSIIERQPLLQWLYVAGGFDGSRDFLLFLGFGVLAVLVLGNTLIAFGTWQLFRFNFLRGHSIGRRLLVHYLGQPYRFFLDRNSAELGKNIITEVHRVVVGVIVPAMQVATKVTVIACLFLLLLAADPLLAVLVTGTLGGAYAGLHLFTRRRLKRLGAQSVRDGGERFQVVSEAFGGVKEAKLMGREASFIDRFTAPSYRYASSMAVSQAVGYLPKYGFEVLAFGGILLILIYLLQQGQPLVGVLPMLALYAFAGYRVMPALQQLFAGMTQLQYNVAALDLVLADLGQEDSTAAEAPLPPAERLVAREAIAFDRVSFHYPNGTRHAVEDLELAIPANATVGLVGRSGSGKTTAVDLLLGLLEPDRGTLRIDGVALTHDNRRAWQAGIGYVPQAIYLADSSVAENIAFGLPREQIDPEAVRRAARLAQIDGFVASELPDGYATVVGERGVRLSGGQRQRIGIARALYHDPALLVFDEATSALDSETEQAVLEAVRSLKGSRTIVMIAHRVQTLACCDRVWMLDQGRLVAEGSYDELERAQGRFAGVGAKTAARAGNG
jgi:ATP-binding cassette subfamily C protein